MVAGGREDGAPYSFLDPRPPAANATMLEDLLRAAQQLGADGSPSEAPAELLRHVPADFEWEDVADELVGLHGSGDAAPLRALQACLATKDLGAAGPSGGAAALRQKIGHLVDRSILPTCKAWPGPDDEKEEGDHRVEWQALQAKAEIGLGVLKTLAGARQDGQPSRLGPAVLVSAAAYTNASLDPWTTPAAARLAHDLLQGVLARPADRARFLTEHLLAGLLRPLFSRSRPATVTASGRKAEFVEPAPQAVHEDPSLKPWKHEHRYAVAVFEWVVSVSDQDTLAKSWPSYTPILLTLLDSAETGLKSRALRIFGAFWARCPPGLMDRVGLTSVFEGAVFPAVLSLPSLTPEDESLLLLDAAYPALAQLAGLSHAPPPSPLHGQPAPRADGEEAERIITTPDLTAQQRKLLDKIVREGVMTGHFHARDHARLTTLFCEELHLLVSAMGILAMKYLKDLMPMMSDILIDPFGMQYVPALRAATRLLQTAMRCCWPRVPNYCHDILKMLAICWLNTEDDADSQSPSAGKLELREQLARAAAMLCAIMGASDAGTSFHDLVAPLVQKEPSLRGLLPVPSSTTD